MKLALETTTGRPTPLGEVLQLARGPVTATLRFLTNNVAALLPDGVPIALKLYRVSDPATVVATFAAWTPNPAQALYTAPLNALAEAGLAWLQDTTLLARVSYGTPNVDTAQFSVSFGSTNVSGAPITPIVITQPTGPTFYAQHIGTFGGKVAINQVEGFMRAKAAGSLLGLQLSVQDAPTGADLIVEVIKGGVATGKTAKITAGTKVEETIFGAALPVAIGDVIQFKPTQVGSAKPGTNLTVSGVVQLS